jgi:hypothetical protein
VFTFYSEGRIRPITAENTNNGYDALFKNALLTLPGSKKGSIDYFITDHRSDVRMILTEETQWSYTTASMELTAGREAVENALFGQTELDNTRFPVSNLEWQTNTSQYASKVHKPTPVGPTRLLKVMAGDLLSATVKYYYEEGYAFPEPNASGIINGLISILGASNAVSEVAKAASQNIGSQWLNLLPLLNFLQTPPPDYVAGRPEGQLVILFLLQVPRA